MLSWRLAPGYTWDMNGTRNSSRLQAWRRAVPGTQEQAAGLLGLRAGLYREVEAGRYRSRRVSELLERFFGESLDELSRPFHKRDRLPVCMADSGPDALVALQS